MGNLLYLIAVILVIAWLIGFVGYNVGGGLIHILLLIAADDTQQHCNNCNNKQDVN